ncbi:Venom allergen 3 [Papilio xuthus]|uniref:Venom allergen 3 n=1 Tax=Papilio xuthus TaxID=66420 RepID=A0A194QBK2_PAPXU|nr:Venom allergen 3 [Papilio xuthus]
MLWVDLQGKSVLLLQTNDPVNRCIDYEKTVITSKDKQDILDKINSRRDKVASGDIRSLPSAENMMKMVWSDSLQNSAQRWADRCLPFKELDYKYCGDSDGVKIGQNIATVVGDSPGLTPAILVDVWYMELLNMNSSLISRYRQSNQTRQHHYDYFTQLAWAESYQVGCGGVKFKDLTNDRRNRTINRLVCNFSPTGNQIGQSVYHEGYPCSHCPFGGSCDMKYRFLCNAEFQENTNGNINNSDKEVFSSNYNNVTINTRGNITNNEQPINTDKYSNAVLETFGSEHGEENVTGFDYFAHMLRFTSSTEKATSHLKTCKDVIPVDDFIEIFKKRLIKDQMLKQYLLASKVLEGKENLENGYKDATVADIINHIHSTKTTSTTPKPTEPDYFNSTLLANLVEAVIFRNNDNSSTIDAVEDTTNSMSDVSAIKIKAEYGEVLTNLHSTGHYFFPEDDNEQNTNETTESYYDNTSPAVSDIVLEIQELKRGQGTKDFLDEIIDSDFDTDNVTNSDFPSSTILNSDENGK